MVTCTGTVILLLFKYDTTLYAGGVFIAEPNNIKATCRAESVLFHCEHKFGSNVHPLWIINNETYERSQLPRNYFYDGKALSVKYPKLKQNNTSYQCVVESPPAFQNAKSACFYRSAVGYLWVTCDGNFIIVSISLWYILCIIQFL